MLKNDTPLWQLTVGEFKELVSEVVPNAGDNDNDEHVESYDYADGYAFGLEGIAQLMGCSRTTANRAKQSGRFDDAISQHGRKIVINKAKFLEIFNKKEF